MPSAAHEGQEGCLLQPLPTLPFHLVLSSCALHLHSLKQEGAMHQPAFCLLWHWDDHVCLRSHTVLPAAFTCPYLWLLRLRCLTSTASVVPVSSSSGWPDIKLASRNVFLTARSCLQPPELLKRYYDQTQELHGHMRAILDIKGAPDSNPAAVKAFGRDANE